MPLVKAKALKGDCLDCLQDTVDAIASANPALAGILFGSGSAPVGNPPGSFVRSARMAHAGSLPGKAAALREARSAGRPVRILLLASSAGAHPASDAAARLSSVPGLSVAVAAVPDLRIQQIPDRFSALRAVRAALLSRFPAESVVRAEVDAFGEWNDLTANADVALYESAEDASNFRYNPHYAIGRAFLPVLFFDRGTAGPYPLEKEFARQNYAYFWKVFFLNRAEFDLYAKHSIRKGENAVLAEEGSIGPWFAGTFGTT
jgi:hypothetical protein